MEPLRYGNYLDKKKTTGRLFRFIPYPKIQIHRFFFISILISSIILYILPYHIYIPVIFGLINLEFFSVYFLREDINEQCLLMEELFEDEFEKYGIDPNFPFDPLYITKGDRDEIFHEKFFYTSREKSTLQYKIMTYHKVIRNTLIGHIPFIGIWYIVEILIIN